MSIDIEELANFIRRIDGINTLCAFALAEKITEKYALYNPETHVAVPKEPTEEMLEAGFNASAKYQRGDRPNIMTSMYKAMLKESGNE